MKRQILSRLGLTITLLAGIAGSALSSDMNRNADTAYAQNPTRVEMTALIFTPAKPDDMNAAISHLNAIRESDDDSGNSLYVLNTRQRDSVISTLQEKGKIIRKLHYLMPVGDDGKASAFSRRPDEQFSVSMKAYNLLSLNKLPPALAIDFSFKAMLKAPTLADALTEGFGQKIYESGGSVLLPENGALLNIRRTGQGFLVWLISID